MHCVELSTKFRELNMEKLHKIKKEERGVYTYRGFTIVKEYFICGGMVSNWGVWDNEGFLLDRTATRAEAVKIIDEICASLGIETKED